MDHHKDEGFVLVLLLALFAGIIVAGLGAVALVSIGTSSNGGSPISQPLVTYDSK
jgi:hypothetical protein